VLFILDSLKTGYATAIAANLSPYDRSVTADVNQGPMNELVSKVPTLTLVDIAIFKSMFMGAPWSDTTMTAAKYIDTKLRDILSSIASIKAAQSALIIAPVGNNELQRKALL
jgi:hypothetical protein